MHALADIAKPGTRFKRQVLLAPLQGWYLQNAASIGDNHRQIGFTQLDRILL